MKHLLVGLSSLVLLPASAMAASAPLPALVLPAEFHTQPAEVAPVAAEGWWTDFNDPVLNSMVARALADNLDIAQAAARLRQAAAGLKDARGQRLPTLAIGGSGGIQQLSIEDPQGRIFSRAPGFTRTVEQYGLRSAASWEIDLFGRLAAGTRMALAYRDAALADVAGARLTVVAEVTAAYVNVRGFQARLALVGQRERTDADLADLARRRVAQGIAAATDSDAADARLAGTRAERLALATGLEQSFDRLDVLLGRAPGEAAAEMGEGAIPATRHVPDPGSPATLLAARPDIVAASRLVSARDAGVAQAIAARYPRFNIDGFAGFLANGFTNFFTGGSVQLGASGAISVPIFTGGRLAAQEAAARARLSEAVAVYRQTALAAIAEAEVAMTAQRHDTEQARLLGEAADALARASGRASAAERAGMASRIEALAALRQQQLLQDQALVARVAAAQSAITTARALGLPAA